MTAGLVVRPVTLVDLVLDRCTLEWGPALGQCGGVPDPTTFTWDVDFDCSVEPPAATPAWPLGGVDHATAASGALTIAACNADQCFYSTPASGGAAIAGQSVWGYARAKLNSPPTAADTTARILKIATGAYSLRVAYHRTTGSLEVDGAASNAVATGLDLSAYHDFVIQVTFAGAANLWVDSVLVSTYAPGSDANPCSALFGKYGTANEPTLSMTHDRIAFSVLNDVTFSADRCYRTYCTCQNTTRYTKGTKAYRFSYKNQKIPRGITAWPRISSIEHVPTQLDMQRGLGRRDMLTVNIEDWDDEGQLTDPYYSLRTTHTAGSALATLKARNRAYPRRQVIVRDGELDANDSVVLANMTRRDFYVDAWDGPNDGVASIQCGDPLAVLETATVPATSEGSLLADIDAVAVAFDFDEDQGTGYGAAPFTVRIDDEIMLVGARTDDAASSITRGCWGTTAAAHDAGAKIQLCATWEDLRADAIWYDILTRAGVAAALIDTTGAATEAALWQKQLLSRCVSEPVKAGDLLASLTQCMVAFTWWDAEAQLIRWKGIHPLSVAETLGAVDDTRHIIARSVRTEDLQAQRITRAICYYGLIDSSASDTEPNNYLKRTTWIDPSAESANEYNEVREELAGQAGVLPIFNPWVPATSGATANAYSLRYLMRFRDAPTRIVLKLAAKDATPVPGQLLQVTAREIVGADGAPAATTAWIISRKRVEGDSIEYTYELQSDILQTSRRWWFWNTSAASVYTSATAAEKKRAYWASKTTGKMSNGDPGYWFF